ncbi:MAG TPA: hypothetical protein DIT67_10580 [Octadecabacter sp.]|nr:hypothetical protein [Octadecabacter sp.]
MSTPERAFVAAIISQAYADMLGPNDDHAFPAISFLTTTFGEHARWRAHLCALIDLDGQLVAQRIVNGLEGKTELHALTTEINGRHEQSVERARERWLHLKNPHTPPASSV